MPLPTSAADIIDEDVNGSQVSHRGGDALLDVLLAGRVSGDRPDRQTLLGKLRFRSGNLTLVDVEYHDPGSLSGEPLSTRSADAPRSAGDDRASSLEATRRAHRM